MWKVSRLVAQVRKDMIAYIFSRADALQALVECAQPPLVVCRVRGLLLAES